MRWTEFENYIFSNLYEVVYGRDGEDGDDQAHQLKVNSAKGMRCPVRITYW